ncbi:NAD(P)/FAD-dependent oxidoreductase [Haliangium sp.]|uniref:NAD(P)/FAD-dependent oxidoreductase n=1 Tax=Haliangium sp. TaxID=2663208 RepID=UPI003D0ADAE3
MQARAKLPLRVVILGAGYAGQIAAARIARKRSLVELTVIDPSPVFVHRIRLHQVAAGQDIPVSPMKAHLPRRARLVQARAARIDPEARVVHLAPTPDATEAPPVPYDVLLYTLGSIDDRSHVPGAELHTHSVGTRAAAAVVRARIPALAARGGRVVVVGGGLTGIEAATELAEAYPALRLTLVSAGPVGEGLSESARVHIDHVCARLGITTRPALRIREVEAGRLRCEDGSELEFDLCLWAAGMRAPTLGRESGLPVNEIDQLRVDAHLRVLGHEHIFAAGDAASLSDAKAPIRMACATALPMGAHVGDQIAGLAHGRSPGRFRFAYVMQCISLGRRDAVVQMVDGQDRSVGRVFRGRRAVWIKEAVCRMVAGVMRLERRLGLRLYRWAMPRGPRPTRGVLAAPPEGRA